MVRLFALSVPLALAACTIAPPDRAPDVAVAVAKSSSAILYKQALNVIYDDGALCAANRPVAQAVWGGALSGCPHLHSFTVENAGAASSPRQQLQAGRPAGGASVTVSVVADDGSITEFFAP